MAGFFYCSQKQSKGTVLFDLCEDEGMVFCLLLRDTDRLFTKGKEKMLRKGFLYVFSHI